MNRSYYTVTFVLLLLWGCAVPPTIKDVEQITEDTSIVFGSVEVYDEDGTKLTRVCSRAVPDDRAHSPQNGSQ